MVSEQIPRDIDIERIVEVDADGRYFRDAYKIAIHGFLYRFGGTPDIVLQIYRRKRQIRRADEGDANRQWILTDVSVPVGQISAIAGAIGSAFDAFRDRARSEWGVRIDPDGRISPLNR